MTFNELRQKAKESQQIKLGKRTFNELKSTMSVLELSNELGARQAESRRRLQKMR